MKRLSSYSNKSDGIMHVFARNLKNIILISGQFIHTLFQILRVLAEEFIVTMVFEKK